MAKGKTGEESKENMKSPLTKKKKKSKSTDDKIHQLITNKKKKKSTTSAAADATISEIVNGITNETLKKEKKSSEKLKKEEEELYRFPQSRIRRIIKSDNSAIHIAEDSVFLINKASEKFLELFCKEAYAGATLDKKKHVEYKHLSSVVSKRERFDFLSDFVPEKVKAGVALAEISSAQA